MHGWPTSMSTRLCVVYGRGDRALVLSTVTCCGFCPAARRFPSSGARSCWVNRGPPVSRWCVVPGASRVLRVLAWAFSPAAVLALSTWLSFPGCARVRSSSTFLCSLSASPATRLWALFPGFAPGEYCFVCFRRVDLCSVLSFVCRRCFWSIVDVDWKSHGVPRR